MSWKTYQWEMRTVWLQNVLLHQPKRWLPEKYPNYDELLTAAVEAAVNEPSAPAGSGFLALGQCECRGD